MRIISLISSSILAIAALVFSPLLFANAITQFSNTTPTNIKQLNVKPTQLAWRTVRCWRRGGGHGGYKRYCRYNRWGEYRCHRRYYRGWRGTKVCRICHNYWGFRRCYTKSY